MSEHIGTGIDIHTAAGRMKAWQCSTCGCLVGNAYVHEQVCQLVATPDADGMLRPTVEQLQAERRRILTRLHQIQFLLSDEVARCPKI